MKFAFTRKMVKVTAQKDGTRLGQPDQEALMARRVSGRRNERDCFVAEYIIVPVDNDRLIILQLDELVWPDRGSSNRVTEHKVALGFLNNPRRARIVVPVPGMVSVRMGHCQIGNVGGSVSNLSQLASQGFVDLVVLRASAFR